jgi:hypothetical protein
MMDVWNHLRLHAELDDDHGYKTRTPRVSLYKSVCAFRELFHASGMPIVRTRYCMLCVGVAGEKSAYAALPLGKPGEGNQKI